MSWSPGYVSPWSPYITYKRAVERRPGWRPNPVSRGWTPPVPIEYLPGHGEAPPRTKEVYYPAPREPVSIDVFYEASSRDTDYYYRAPREPLPSDVLMQSPQPPRGSPGDEARLWAFVPAQSAVRFRRAGAEEGSRQEVSPTDLLNVDEYVRKQVDAFSVRLNLGEYSEVTKQAGIVTVEEYVSEARERSPFTRWEKLVYTPSNWLWERSKEYQGRVTPDIKGLGASIAASATAFGAGVTDFLASLAAPWTIFTGVTEAVKRPGEVAKQFSNPYSWARIGGSVLAGYGFGKALGWAYSKAAPRVRSFTVEVERVEVISSRSATYRMPPLRASIERSVLVKEPGLELVAWKETTYRVPGLQFRVSESFANVYGRAVPSLGSADDVVGGLSYSYISSKGYSSASLGVWAKQGASIAGYVKPRAPTISTTAEKALGGNVLFTGKGGGAPVFAEFMFEKTPVSVDLTKSVLAGGVRATKRFALAPAKYVFEGTMWSKSVSVEPFGLGGRAASALVEVGKVATGLSKWGAVPMPVTYSFSAGEFAVFGAFAPLSGLSEGEKGEAFEGLGPRSRAKVVELPRPSPISFPRPRGREDVFGLPKLGAFDLVKKTAKPRPRVRKVPKPAIDVVPLEAPTTRDVVGFSLALAEAEAPRPKPPTAVTISVPELSPPGGGSSVFVPSPTPYRPGRRRSRRAKKKSRGRRYGELLYPEVRSPSAIW